MYYIFMSSGVYKTFNALKLSILTLCWRLVKILVTKFSKHNPYSKPTKLLHMKISTYNFIIVIIIKKEDNYAHKHIGGEYITVGSSPVKEHGQWTWLLT